MILTSCVNDVKPSRSTSKTISNSKREQGQNMRNDMEHDLQKLGQEAETLHRRMALLSSEAPVRSQSGGSKGTDNQESAQRS
jgi:hypothetical protein